jgi:hypothetical protein
MPLTIAFQCLILVEWLNGVASLENKFEVGLGATKKEKRRRRDERPVRNRVAQTSRVWLDQFRVRPFEKKCGAEEEKALHSQAC